MSPSASDAAIVAAEVLFSFAVKVALLVKAGAAESATLATVTKMVFALVLVGLLETGLVTSPDGLIGWMAGLALMLAVGIDCRIRRELSRESVA